MGVGGQNGGRPKIGSILACKNMLACEPWLPRQKSCPADAQSALQGLLLKVGEGQFGAKVYMMWDQLDQRVTIFLWDL